jgi:hypothetical protein
MWPQPALTNVTCGLRSLFSCRTNRKNVLAHHDAARARHNAARTDHNTARRDRTDMRPRRDRMHVPASATVAPGLGLGRLDTHRGGKCGGGNRRKKE